MEKEQKRVLFHQKKEHAQIEKSKRRKKEEPNDTLLDKLMFESPPQLANFMATQYDDIVRKQ
jgi:hypothetical protein